MSKVVDLCLLIVIMQEINVHEDLGLVFLYTSILLGSIGIQRDSLQ